MPEVTAVNKVNSDLILTALKDSTHGYHFGKPKRPDEKALTVLMPILRKTNHDRGYTTFPESDTTMVFDTGTVSEIDVENKGDTHVFIRTGTMFKGSTQERTLQRSIFLMKGAKNRINVRCVHMTRATGHAKMSYGGITTNAFMQKCYTSGFTPKGQGDYWNNVHEETSKMRCMMGGHNVGMSMESGADMLSHLSPPTGGGSEPIISGWSSALGKERRPVVGRPAFKADDLAANMMAFEKNYEELLSKVKLEDDQVGVVLITDTGVQMIESFDHPASWKSLHETAVKAMGTDMVKEDKESVFEFKPDHALSLTQKVLAMDFEHNAIYHHPGKDESPSVTITGLTAKGYVGEVVEVNGEVIHLVLFKQA